jgi:quercetin dioxygenase-like cupin family protein
MLSNFNQASNENTIISEGDYLYTPANFKHSVSSKKGWTILFVLPQEVEFLKAEPIS